MKSNEINNSIEYRLSFKINDFNLNTITPDMINNLSCPIDAEIDQLSIKNDEQFNKLIAIINLFENLKSLYFFNCHFMHSSYGYENYGIAIIKNLENLPYLNEISFCSTNISIEAAKAINALLIKNRILEKLHFDSSIREEGIIEEVFIGLKNNFSVLQLSNNKIGNAGGQSIAKLLENNPSLISIDLNWNIIEEEGVKAIAQSFKTNKTLLNIKVGENSFGNPNFISLLLNESWKYNISLDKDLTYEDPYSGTTQYILTDNLNLLDQTKETLSTIVKGTLSQVKLEKNEITGEIIMTPPTWQIKYALNTPNRFNNELGLDLNKLNKLEDFKSIKFLTLASICKDVPNMAPKFPEEVWKIICSNLKLSDVDFSARPDMEYPEDNVKMEVKTIGEAAQVDQ